MEAKGVLNDTLVVVLGDHRQSPEFGLPSPYSHQSEWTRVPAALIANGHLGKYEGTVIEDATHRAGQERQGGGQYDWLNTLADIVGVPESGFTQSGVGRSLKRSVAFGERVVWSNNPFKKLSAVRGYERIVYDRTSDEMALYDTQKDPLEQNDLLSTKSDKEVADWKEVRKADQTINSNFINRWDKKCLTQVDC